MDILLDLRTDLWSELSNLVISGIAIAVISSLFTEAVKISSEKVFIKHKPGSLFIWIFNTLLIGILCTLFPFIFAQESELNKRVLYILFLLFTAWPVSVLSYTLIIRIFMTGAKILYTKAKDYYVDSQTDLVQSTLLLKKSELLLTKKIALDKLEESDVIKPEENKDDVF